MTLKEEIIAIKDDPTLTYEEKAERLSKLITGKELASLLPKPSDIPTLKNPMKPTGKATRMLNLSLKAVYFDQILRGAKKVEYRDWSNEYYRKKCSYTENGKTYLVPFDAITFYQGRQRSMVVEVVGISCNGTYLMFRLGRILRKPT